MRCEDSKDLFFSRETLKKDLKKKSVQSAITKVLANGTSITLTLISTIILARLLGPKEFGLMAMVLTLTEFARYIMEMGLGTATVQRENITHYEVTFLFWVNFGFGTILMIALAALSPAVAWFYGEPRLIYICLIISTACMFRGLAVQHRSLLERQMRFGYLGLSNLTSTLLSIIIAIALAFYGFGVWALVWREISFAFIYALCSWLFCGWIPGLPRKTEGIRKSLRFGVHLSTVSIIQYLTLNTDRILIGRLCGASSLGFYMKAFQLVAMPIENIRSTFWDIGLAPLSTIANDHKKYISYYGKLLSAMSFIYMPMVVFLIIQSEDIILLLLGEKWMEAAPIMRVIAIAGFVTPLTGSIQLVMISCGNTKKYLKWGSISGTCMITGYFIGVKWGAFGVACSYAVCSYILLVAAIIYCLRNSPVTHLDFIKSFIPSALISWVAGLSMLLLLPYVSEKNTLLTLAKSMSILFFVYVVLWITIPDCRKKIFEFWSFKEIIFKKA